MDSSDNLVWLVLNRFIRALSFELGVKSETVIHFHLFSSNAIRQKILLHGLTPATIFPPHKPHELIHCLVFPPDLPRFPTRPSSFSHPTFLLPRTSSPNVSRRPVTWVLRRLYGVRRSLGR